jgi:cysteinylglycine-S-conjugate dipeptidase
MTNPEHDVFKSRVSDLMPELISELEHLVSIPSVAFPGYPPEPVLDMANATMTLLHQSGAPNARLLDVPGDYPAVYADIPGPEGAPTLLLYAHYDVQPAPLEQGWETDPWTPTHRNGRMYGRGAADDKSGIIAHLGLLRAFGGTPPVNVKVLIEGMEETDSHLEDFVENNPELVRCDAAVICDSGNPSVGVPGLTTALRGTVSFVIEVDTLDHPLHSGVFGGGAPDALTALTRMIASLHDANGDVAVSGLHSFAWDSGSVDEAGFRRDAEVLDGVELIGSGDLASRLWSKPSISVIGMDVPSVAGASNVLLPSAKAHVSMRVAPGANLDAEFETVKSHLLANAPWGARVNIEPGRFGAAYRTTASEPATAALEAAFGEQVRLIGQGGSIPLVNTLAAISPEADMILWGAEDTAQARIHASNESVDLAELERIILTQVLLAANMAK